MKIKTISRTTYLKALGLFTLASAAQRKCDEAESAMNELLGADNGSHASDAIYNYGGGDFDAALKHMKIKVKPK